MSLMSSMRVAVATLPILFTLGSSGASRPPNRTSASIVSSMDFPQLQSNSAVGKVLVEVRKHGTRDSVSEVLLGSVSSGVPVNVALSEPTQHAVGKGHKMLLSIPANVFAALGITITLIGQTTMVPGMLIQKMAHNTMARSSPRGDPEKSALEELVASKPYYLDCWWLLGGAIYIIGHIFCWIGLGMAPQSICSCLQSWNIVVTMLLSPLMLKEHVPENGPFYASMIVLGCIWVVIFGTGPSDGYSGENLQVVADILLRPLLLAPLGVLILLYAGIKLAALHDVHVPQAPVYTFIAAGCAWYSASLSKSIAMLCLTSALTDNWIISKYTAEFAVLVFFFVVMAVGQIHFLNMGLKYGDAIAIVPLYEALSMVGQIVFGGLLWHEFAGLTWKDRVGFFAGVTFVIAGLTLLTSAAHQKDAFASVYDKLSMEDNDANVQGNAHGLLSGTSNQSRGRSQLNPEEC